MTEAATSQQQVAKPQPQPKQHRLEVGRFELAEYKRRHFYAVAEQGVTLEVLKDPAYWANYGAQMTPWSIVEVHTEDGTLWAELLVLACGRAWAKMHVLRHVSLSTADVERSQVESMVTHRYEWKGPNKRHCIIRSDGEIMHEGAQTKADALAWAVTNGVTLT